MTYKEKCQKIIDKMETKGKHIATPKKTLLGKVRTPQGSIRFIPMN